MIKDDHHYELTVILKKTLQKLRYVGKSTKFYIDEKCDEVEARNLCLRFFENIRYIFQTIKQYISRLYKMQCKL